MRVMFEENRNSLDAVTLQIFKKVENQTCMREIFGPSSLTKNILFVASCE